MHGIYSCFRTILLLFLCLIMGSSLQAANYNYNTGAQTLGITLGTNQSLTVTVAGPEIRFTVNIGTFSQTGPNTASGSGTSNIAILASTVATSLTVNNTGVFPGTNNVTFSGNSSISTGTLAIDLSGDGVGMVAFIGGFDVSVSTAMNIATNRNISVGSGSQLTAMNAASILFEANQQPTVTSGSFIGISLLGAAVVETTGSGALTLKGRGGDTGNSQRGIQLASASEVNGGTGNVTIEGTGGASTGNFNWGVDVAFNSKITSSGGDVVVNGTAGGSGVSARNHGVAVSSNCEISASGTGTVNVVGAGAITNGTSSWGVYVDRTSFGTFARITSEDGDVMVNGTGGGSGSSGGHYGVYVANGGEISASGTGNVSVEGTGGNSTGSNNTGVLLFVNSKITSAGGDISVVGTAGGPTATGVGIDRSEIVAGGMGKVSVIGAGASATGNRNHGVNVDGAASRITSSGGDVAVKGTAGGSGTSGSNYGTFVYRGGTISAGGQGNVSVEGSGGNPTGFDNRGVCISTQFSNNVSSIFSSGGEVVITAVEGGGTTSIGFLVEGVGSSVTTAAAGGGITIFTNSIDLRPNTTISTQSGHTCAIAPYTSGTAIDLGSFADPLGGPIGLTDAELDRITTGTLIIGDANSGTITVSAAISRPSSTNMELRSGADITFNQEVNTSGGNLLLAPGDAPAAVYPDFSGTDATVNTLSFASDLAIAINGTTPGNGTGSTYSQLAVVGEISLSGVDLILNGSHTPVSGDVFTIVDNDGVEPIMGTFTGLPEGATIPNFLSSGLDATITYMGGDGNDVVLEVVCDITITNVSLIDETCPGANDGTLTATATCGSCSGGTADIRYSIDSIDFSNTTGVFTGLAPGNYTVYVRDVNDNNCTDSDGTHTINAGVDNEDPFIIANALDFDGSNDYVIIPDAPSQDVGENFTLETWFKSGTTVSNYRSLLDKRDNNNFTNFSMAVFNGQDATIFVNHPGGNTLFIVAENVFTFGNWHHYAVTYDGNNLRQYVDGVLVNNETIAISNPQLNVPIYIGQAAFGSERFDGQMDEVRIWSQALSQTEIQSGMNCKLTGTESDLIAYYNFDQGVAEGNNASETTLLDQSSNGNIGTLSNFALNGSSSNWVEGATGLCILADYSAECSATPPTPTANDNCSGSIDGVPNVSFPITDEGTTVVTWTFTDGTGNSITADQNVIVTDEAPIVNTQNHIVQLDASGQASILPADIDNGSTDDCGIQSYELDITDFDCADIGVTNALDFDGTDDYVELPEIAELNATSQFTIEARITLKSYQAYAPIFTKRLSPAQTIQVQMGGAFNGQEYIAFNVGNGNDGYEEGSTLLELNQEYLISAVYDGSLAEQDRLRVYIDGVAEVMTNFRSNPATTANLSGVPTYLCNENNSGFSDIILSELRVWNTARSAGEVSANLVGEINTPQPGLIANYHFNQGFAGGNNSGETTLEDQTGSFNGTLNGFALNGATSNWINSNVHIVTLTVTDVNGNSSDGTAEVTILDTIAPVAICQDITVELDAGGVWSVGWGDIDGGSNDVCGLSGFTINGEDFVEYLCEDLGMNEAILTVTDNSGNASSCTATVTVEDNIAPVAICPTTAPTVVLDGIGNGTLAENALAGGNSTDNCAAAVTETSPMTSFTCADAPSGMVILTATDAAGNMHTASCTVNIEDNIFPTLQCINQTITFNGDQNINLDADDLVDAMDNCGVQSILLSPPIISSSQVGQTVPVSVSVTDVGGNTSECISQVTVNGLPFGWSQNTDGIGCNDGNDIDYNAATQVWTATSTNCYYSLPFSSDATAFAQHTLCGNGSITARVTGISGSALGWAGVVMRESNAPGAKKAQLTTNLSNFHRREFRRVTNGAAYPQQFPGMNRYWLRIKRSGNQFRMEVSPNGANWFFVGAQNIVMPSCIEVGLVVTNYNSNSTVTATFANVSIEGGASMQALGQMNYTNIDRENKIDAHKGFILYPNPANSEVWLNLGNYHSQDIRIELLDMQGRTIHVEEVRGATTDNHVLKLMNYPSGIYLVKVTGEDRVPVVERLVIGRN